jgi:hypothetical protein
VKQIQFVAMALLALLFCAIDVHSAESAKTRTEKHIKGDAPRTQASSASTPASEPALSRIDATPTAQNSYLQEFAPGVIFRVPRILYPTLDYAKLKQPVKAERIGMTFFYPDMTLTDLWSPEVEKRTDMTYRRPLNRFWVKILWMYYVPPDSDSFGPGSEQPLRSGPDPRPPRIELNRHCYEMVQGHCNFPMRRIPSGLVGIDAEVSDDWAKTHPEILQHHPENGGVYLAKPESPYELFMDCQSLHCQAYVYSKKHHLQYRMLFPPEGVARTDELIKKIDKMLDQWAVK